MKLSRISLATLFAVAAVSFGANAAGSYVGNSGKVTFLGSVVDAPCNLAPGQDGMDIKVDFGELSMSQLNAGETSARKFEIHLENCNMGTEAAKKTAEITFNSPDQMAGKNLLGTNGLAKNLAIGINNITFGSAASITGMTNGDNTLTYTAVAQKATTGEGSADVTAGDFTAATNFLISYK
ncbi:fimbrial protein [Serratia fonticola]